MLTRLSQSLRGGGSPARDDQSTTPRASSSRGFFGRRRSSQADSKPSPSDDRPKASDDKPPSEAKRAPAEAKNENPPRAEAKGSKPEAAAAKNTAPSRDRPRLPELERYLRDKDAGRYAAAASAVCATLGPDDIRAMGAPELGRLCDELGFGARAAETYEQLFRDHALDGWVFAEVEDWEDYAEIGVERVHAVTLVCVAKAARGHFGALDAGGETETEDGDDLTASERAALRDADRAAEETGEGKVYGQLIVLGYKEYRVEGSTWHPVGARNEKFPLKRREQANGIRRSRAYVADAPPGDPRRAAHQRSRGASHSVTMSVAAGARGADGRPVPAPQRVTVEYAPDAREDMYQLGRMIVPQNDFVVRGPLHLDAGGVLCGPVSRYACRLACSRRPPYACTLYAAGFNNERDVFLSEQAPKWQLAPGETAADARGPRDEAKEPDGAQWDALTTFGVRIWKPEIGAWREVSVHGGVHEPRQRADVAGRRYPGETSELTDGTIVDLAGIQLLYESAASMRAHERAARSGDRRELSNGDEPPLKIPGDPRLAAPSRIVARFNARRPQCPVQLHTIRLEYDDDKRRALAQDRRPYIFPACGHVHAFAPELQRLPCPLCRARGPFVELRLEWEPAICDDEPEVCFNPCGHIVSERVARRWAALALPDNAPPNARYRPICPFCAKPLKSDARAGDHPYNRILFQSDTRRDDDGETLSDDGAGSVSTPGSRRARAPDSVGPDDDETVVEEDDAS